MWPVSSQFKEELSQPVHSVAVKVEFLRTNFQSVSHIRAYSTTSPNDAVIDGTVDVDVTRGTRRTLTLSLLNPDGTFTADSNIFSEPQDWDGFFYVNRLIRVWRGVRFEGGEEELVPIGTFMVDKSETLVERGMSTVVIAGSDLWKKFTKSQFGSPRKFNEGTLINTIIEDLADEAGVTQISLDPLTERGSAGKTVQRDFVFEADITRGDALKKICDDYGIEIYFDPMGVLVTRDFRKPFERPTIWRYSDEDDLAFFIRSVVNDERLYNHVIVVGTAKAQDGGTIFRAELKNTDSSSPTSIDKIGDRVFRYESPLLGSQEAVNQSASTIYYKHFLLSQTVALEAICNPAIEGNDVIKIQEGSFTGLNDRFLISTFSVPLVTSKQKITVKRVIDVAPT